MSLTCQENRFLRRLVGEYYAYTTDLVLDFRQNDKSDWTSIGGSNKPMSYIVHNISGEGIIRKVELQYKNDCAKFREYCWAKFSVQIEYYECLSDKKMPTFRCRSLGNNQTLYKSREGRLPLKGEKTK